MRPLMSTRTLAAAGSLVLIAALSACGGDSDGGGSAAPDNASTEDFCTAFNGLVDSVLADTDISDPTTMVAAIKKWAGKIEDVGTPSDMPDDARAQLIAALTTALPYLHWPADGRVGCGAIPNQKEPS